MLSIHPKPDTLRIPVRICFLQNGQHHDTSTLVIRTMVLEDFAGHEVWTTALSCGLARVVGNAGSLTIIAGRIAVLPCFTAFIVAVTVAVVMWFFVMLALTLLPHLFRVALVMLFSIEAMDFHQHFVFSRASEVSDSC